MYIKKDVPKKVRTCSPEIHFLRRAEVEWPGFELPRSASGPCSSGKWSGNQWGTSKPCAIHDEKFHIPILRSNLKSLQRSAAPRRECAIHGSRFLMSRRSDWPRSWLHVSSLYDSEAISVRKDRNNVKSVLHHTCVFQPALGKSKKSQNVFSY